MNNVQLKKYDENFKAKITGYHFKINNNKWVLSRDYIVNVAAVTSSLSIKLKEGYLRTLAFYACKYSPAYVKHINKILRHFFEENIVDYIDEPNILNYRGGLPKEKKNYLTVLRNFFTTWCSLGYYGVDEKVLIILKSMRIKVKEPGDVVKQENPEKGALTDNEHKFLNKAIYKSYSNEKITLQECSLALLASFTGRRPQQITSLKHKDMIKGISCNGEASFSINFPRIKQGLKFRQVFRNLKINDFLFGILIEQVNHSVNMIETLVVRELNTVERNEVPIFLKKSDCERIIKGGDILELLTSDKLHVSKSVVDSALKKVIQTEAVLSERTGEKIKINARRLRYTIGTKLARDGCDVRIIAELLDHSSTASAGVYVENLADGAVRINQAVSAKLSFIADVFLGKVKSSRKFEDCSTCPDISPIPCHSCIHFRAFGKKNEGMEVAYE